MGLPELTTHGKTQDFGHVRKFRHWCGSFHKSPRDTTFFAADFCQQRRIALVVRRHTAVQRSWPWFWRQAHAWTYTMRRLATTETRCANDKRGAPSKQLQRPNQPNHAASPTPSQGQKLPRDLSSHNTSLSHTRPASTRSYETMQPTQQSHGGEERASRKRRTNAQTTPQSSYLILCKPKRCTRKSANPNHATCLAKLTPSRTILPNNHTHPRTRHLFTGHEGCSHQTPNIL